MTNGNGTIILRGRVRGATARAIQFQITGPQSERVSEQALSRRFWFPRRLIQLGTAGEWDVLQVPRRLLQEKIRELASTQPAQPRLYGEDIA